MQFTSGDETHSLSRRKVVLGLASGLALGLAGGGAAPALAARDPVAQLMTSLKGPLLKAARNASTAQFLRVIRNHADVKQIALYSLGDYRNGLESSRSKAYYRGVALYMSKYFALMSKEYKVVDAELSGASWRDGDSWYIDSKIKLNTGRSYNVRWELVKRGSKYKIANVRVLGFWLAWLQRRQFQSFISSRGGSVNSLVVALNP